MGIYRAYQSILVIVSHVIATTSRVFYIGAQPNLVASFVILLVPAPKTA